MRKRHNADGISLDRIHPTLTSNSMSPSATQRPSFDAALAQVLASRRHTIGLPQSALADELGVDQATVSKVESGRRKLSAGEAMQWLEALGLSPAESADTLSQTWAKSGQRPESLWEMP